MKKLIWTFCLFLTATWVLGQTKSNPQEFTGGVAEQEKSMEPGVDPPAHVYFQVGSGVHYSHHEMGDGATFDVRFPWDVAYIPLTFQETEFEVSKGYYSEKVQLNWNILSNLHKIDQIKIYRRVYTESNIDDITNYVLLTSLPSDSYSYEDTDTQGGILYEYKVEAVGVSSIPKKYITYITGIGFRNPTGVVTGNVSFDGGSPVKDVVLRADPQGAEVSIGSSLLFTSASSLEIDFENKELNEFITLQGWVKLNEGTGADLFILQDNQRTTDEITVSYATTNNSLAITVTHTSLGSKTFTISDYYPTGNVDGRGDDIFNPFNNAGNPVSDFANNFVHISIVLNNIDEPLFYLNGRNIDEEYVAGLPDYTTTIPTIVTSGSYTFGGFETAKIVVADGLEGNVDELRFWDIALDAERIRTDFKRYLGGSESNLVSYLRCDEKAGRYAYDISSSGIEFNKNNGTINLATWVDEKPTSTQLGILGVTDSLGNYIISAIPFSGAGESYTITPMFGVHQFNPSQQLVYIGKGSEVINKIDFTDISSFFFLGRVYYNTTGIFEPIEEVQNVTSVLEGGYNEYSAIIDGNEQLISKGKYFYDEVNDKLYETPKVYLAGANVYIDGDIVLDKDKRPVVTDAEGAFKIRVPIGNHYIEVRKNKHVFTHGGRFPASRDDGDDLFEFFEHQESAISFIDTTKVVLVGRVVGGTREAEKPIGFGHNGLLEETYNPGTDQEETVAISSVNNIGQATITLSYLPFGGTPGIGELEHTIVTNPETGEYRAELLPLSYSIDQATGLRVNNNVAIQLLDANETVNISAAQDTVYSEYVDPDGNTVFSDPYHFVKSFTYRSVPVLNVAAQSADTEVIITQGNNGTKQDVTIDTKGFQYPVYTQGLKYGIVFETFEEYINYDGATEEADQVPIADGEFIITNNLALAGSERLEVDTVNESISRYFFRGGMPSISPPFTRTISIKYRVDGVDYDARNYNSEGIILGGQSDGSQTFVTEAPDVPDIILRDPPGSNSFASIEKGKSISFTESGSFNFGQKATNNLKVLLGGTIAAGGGLAGPVAKVENVNNLNVGLALSVSSNDGRSQTKTYTFTETISTSDDPKYVSSKGDLYIGNTNNYYYGTYDDVQANGQKLGDAPSLELTNDSGESISISKQKAFYFSEQPTETFFIYSQNHILTTLIPELEKIVEGIDLGLIDTSTPGVLSRAQYVEQIRLWEKVIQDNERTKYRALNDRQAYKDEIEDNLNEEIDDLNGHLIAMEVLGAASVIVGVKVNPLYALVGIQTIADASTQFARKKSFYERKLEELEDRFYKNVSFDAGLGAYTQSSQISIAQQSTRRLNLELDASIALELGAKVNDFGLVLTTGHEINTSIETALSEDEVESTTVSYTFKDNDLYNFLSVDVINAFDGNGPIFSTIGGRTSCPYEGADSTLFYNNAEYLAADEDARDTLVFSGGEQLSFATQQVEVPLISVEVASVTDVPEERAAEFTLLLENNSVAGADAYFNLYVDNTTNPNNAIFNIGTNGTVVFVPYGQKVEYALTLEKSISDVYEYKDISIVLGSICDGVRIYDAVNVSAVFKPSCTAVELDAPLENWVMNADDAYNDDNSTNPLNIAVTDYNRAFTSFEDYRLEYRKSTSSTWTRLQSYYNTQELLDAAILEGEDQGTLIAENTTYYPWDIGALGLSDGVYELRAVSNCSNGTTYISKVVQGTVDLNVPVQFGTPSPTDGILGAGEDLRLQFSEDVLYSSAISKIEIKGETNQQEIDHNVSLYFEGSGNNVVIEKPNITSGDFTMEFWLKNLSTAPAVLFEQAGRLKVSINNGVMEWMFGSSTITKAIAIDKEYHHYTLTYSAATKRMRIYQDDQDLGAEENTNGLTVRSDNSLIIGGNNFIGNLHDLRLWSKGLSLSEAYAAQFNELMGSERDLVGYYPMNEGTGTYANDLARYKHAAIQAEWDIKPKGTAYDFNGSQYLVLDKTGFVQISDLMDVTLSFWIKTGSKDRGTIFSNGRGNTDDLVQSNGKRNKWAVTLNNGVLHLLSEGMTYELSTTNLADNNWHHVAIVLRRIGSLKTYVDARQESSHPMSQIGGMSGNKIWIGARGHISSGLVETVDEVFTGKIDEVRLWNLARATEQLERDRFNEVDFNSIGLMLYAQMNEPDPKTGTGPKYYHKAANEIMLPDNAVLSAGAVSYTEDAPKIKLVRPYLSFEVSHVINGDEMILTPLVSDWSVLEGQIIDITVDRMFDVHGNRQESPITWSAYVRRNEVTWYVEDGSQRLDVEKQESDPYSFVVTILNKGGKDQPFSIEKIPSWLSASETSGTLEPNSSVDILFEIEPSLSVGEYSQDLFLDTDFNFDEKILIDLRVLAEGPQWAVDPSNFEYSMNIIGKVVVDGVFSVDEYTKVGAFAGTELRGEAYLEYDKNYDEHFLYLSVYSNQSSGEEITFKVWDATQGKILHATIDGNQSLTFLSNEVLGTKSNPVLFENTSFVEQFLSLNAGWTWISMYTDDPKLGNLDDLFAPLALSDGDLIKSQISFDLYDHGSGWDGTLSQSGGLNVTNMYKVKLASANQLILGGDEVDATSWTKDVVSGWNWLAYPLSNNVSTNDALALLEATEGDLIKNQRAFAIYDPLNGWTGTLSYLKAGEGYMLKSAIEQSFSYPDIFSSGSGRIDQIASLEVEDWSSYEYNMNMVAEVMERDLYDAVWVLDENGNTRGRAVVHEMDGKQISFVTVFGDKSMGQYQVFLEKDGQRTASSSSFNFNPDALLGTLSKPVELRISDVQFTLFPNAFKSELNINFLANDSQESEVVLYDVLGKRAYQQSLAVREGANQVIISPEIPAGLYILNMMVDGRLNTYRVIKK